LHRSRTKHFHHRAVGDLHLSFDALELPGEPGLTLTAYCAEKSAPSADNLASWAATNVEAAPA
jgi:MmyB-like transcription regulator ligand binding domain